MFDGVNITHIHKSKYSILVRPVFKDEPDYLERMLKRVPVKKMDKIRQSLEERVSGQAELLEYMRDEYKIVGGSGFYDGGSEPCDYWPYENEDYFDKEQPNPGSETGTGGDGEKQ